jgi:hypothetical protein
MAHMSEERATQNDRRDGQRFQVNAPVTLFVGESQIPAYTRDLNNRGAYLFLALADSTQVRGEFDFTVELPPEITQSAHCQIQCRGRAVRTEPTAADLAGMAVEILKYAILRDTGHQGLPTNS